MSLHEITKVRKDVVRRSLRVRSTELLTPRMRRIVFESDELEGFDSPSPDDHIKIFLPANAGETPVMRDFTPRQWDIPNRTLTLDFALHESGPATEWARTAKPGDPLGIGGPRGSTVVADDFHWYLLVGDASALPSMARRLEGLREGVPVHVVAVVADSAEQQSLATRAAATTEWIVCMDDPRQQASALRDALAAWPFPEGDGFIWISAEASVARDLYTFVVDTWQHPAAWVKAAAYWTHHDTEPEAAH